jgi:prevent-host-death family protein
MERISVVALKQTLAEVLNRAEYKGLRVVIHRRGKDAAALIPIEDLKLLERLIEDAEDRLDLEASRAALAESDVMIPFDGVRRELGLLDEPRESTVSGRHDRGRTARPQRAAKKGT